MENVTVVRIGSHRANDKLKRANLGHVETYYSADFLRGGYFAFIPNERISEALSIKGISRVRDQNTANYSRTWKSGGLA